MVTCGSCESGALGGDSVRVFVTERGHELACCKRAKLAPARCGLLPPQPGDDQNRRLARVVGQLEKAVSPYTLRKYGACGSDLTQHGRDRIDQGAAILLADGVPVTGVGMRSGAADGLCELHTPSARWR